MAELALAVVPIFFGAVKGFTILQEKIHLLRHYRKEVKWLRTRVDVQLRCFRGEVHHVVIDTLDTHLAQSLVTDDEHMYWKNKDLEGQLKRHMGDLHLQFVGAMEEVNAALKNIEAKLALFAPPDKTSPIFEATKDKFRLAFRKEEYKEDINTLKECIAELKRIRKLARAIQKSTELRAKSSGNAREDAVVGMEPPAEPDLSAVKQYRGLRHLSSACQTVLQQWTCSSGFHSYHSSRLFIGHTPQRISALLMLETAGRQNSVTLSNRLLFGVQSQQLGLLTPESFNHSSFEDFDRPSPKRRRVSDDCQSDQQRTDTGSLCQQLEACWIAPCARSFAFVDSQARQRFLFESKPMESELVAGWDTHKTAVLAKLLGCQPHSMMLDSERIQLAITILRATLMNHSTPAWPQGCLLEGIALLHNPNGEIDVSVILNTLNIPVPLGSGDALDMDMDSESIAASEDELQFKYGIRNLELHRLGAAFLSIGLWSVVDWKDVVSVRRKAAALDSLGKKYRDAVERLLYNNFGVETTDLNDERLQVEILRTIVAPLERRAKSRRR